MVKFDLSKAQILGEKKGSSTTNYVVAGLLSVVIMATLGGTIFSYLGTGQYGIGNSTNAPGAPVWLSPLLIVVVSIGFVFLVMKAFGVGGKK